MGRFVLMERGAGPMLVAQTGAPVKLQIRADQVTAHMPPTFHGLMTEEINYAFEGGLYAEMVRNRSFEDAAQPVGAAVVDDRVARAPHLRTRGGQRHLADADLGNADEAL